MNDFEAGPSVPPVHAPPDPRGPSSLLAPGFRFHPTDEELVIYYLKRKVSGRPLRVDAIGELDLYKCEPWDLPSFSRLRSGDREWYFFTHLDRKYANRSRTNRTTVHGYWKTTGKDRAVVHRGNTVGMKKTLVYHAGRAPTGKRSNWVMHEYRLEDPLPQYSYVVCRIFEKNGAGPQNGAQYGAPFNEEEWEQDGQEDCSPQPLAEQEYLQMTGPKENDGLAVEQDYLQMTDFMEDVANPRGSASPLTERIDEQNAGEMTEPTFLLEDFLDNQHLLNGVDGYIDLPEELDLTPTSGMEENDVLCLNNCSPNQSDGYLELNDIFESEKTCEIPNNSVAEGISYTNTDLFYAEKSRTVQGHCFEGFHGSTNCNSEPLEVLPGDTNVLQNDNNFLQNDVNALQNDPPEQLNRCKFSYCYPPGQSTEDLDFFDASSNNLKQETLTQADDFLYSVVGGTSDATDNDVSYATLDSLDELMAFFDATDNDVSYATLDSLEMIGNNCSNGLDSPPVIGNVQSSKASSQMSGEGVGSTSIALPSTDNKSNNKKEVASGVPDIPRSEGYDISLSKCLVNMLGSISSPPALAAELPALSINQLAKYSSTDSGNSIHVTTRMIHIRTLTMSYDGKHWSLEREGSMEVLLTYGLTGNDGVGKQETKMHEAKMHGGILVEIFRGWFSALIISALLAAASCRIGLCICSL